MKINKYNNFKNISGTKIKQLRLEKKLTQKNLAEKMQLLGIDITSREISKIENNARLVQDFELLAFSEIFEISADIFKIKYN